MRLEEADFHAPAECDRVSLEVAMSGTVLGPDEFSRSLDGTMTVGRVLGLENELPGYAKEARPGLGKTSAGTVLVWGNKFTGYAEDVRGCLLSLIHI